MNIVPACKDGVPGVLKSEWLEAEELQGGKMNTRNKTAAIVTVTSIAVIVLMIAVMLEAV